MASDERKRLDELLARIEAQTQSIDQQTGEASAPEPPEPPRRALPTRESPKDRRPRGLLDLIAVITAVYTMVVTTPVGGMVVRGYNWVTKSQTKTRPLISYFSGDTGSAGTTAPQIKKLVQPNNSAAGRVAKRVGLSPKFARALAFMTASGKTDATGHFEIDLLAPGRSSLTVVGVHFPSKEEPAKRRERRLIKGAAKLRKRLGGIEPAVVALAVELTHVEYALERAKAAGAQDPVSFIQLRPYLPPEHRDEADNLVRGTFALSTAYDMAWPVRAGTRISSPFGYRHHPVLGRRKLHKGTDFAVPRGTKVFAIAEGKVRYATQDGINGRFIKIDHGHGLTSAYCHNSQLKVRRGEYVQKGQLIALSGSTGRSTGPHLHFQMELDRHPIDAELFKPGAAPQIEGTQTATTASR